MNILLVFAVVVIVNLISLAAFAIVRKGIKQSLKALLFTVKSPIKAYKLFASKKADRKLIKENKAYWTVGRELDKVDALTRYKKDARVISHPSVKEFDLKRKAKENSIAIKANKKAGKSKSAKQFNKITK